LNEALQAGGLDIPSKTFAQEFRIRTAVKLLPGLDPATRSQIRQEIIEGTSAEELLRPPPPPAGEEPDGDEPVPGEEPGAEPEPPKTTAAPAPRIRTRPKRPQQESTT
jgi:hypothetical protein